MTQLPWTWAEATCLQTPLPLRALVYLIHESCKEIYNKQPRPRSRITSIIVTKSRRMIDERTNEQKALPDVRSISWCKSNQTFTFSYALLHIGLGWIFFKKVKNITVTKGRREWLVNEWINGHAWVGRITTSRRWLQKWSLFLSHVNKIIFKILLKKAKLWLWTKM